MYFNKKIVSWRVTVGRCTIPCRWQPRQTDSNTWLDALAVRHSMTSCARWQQWLPNVNISAEVYTRYGVSKVISRCRLALKRQQSLNKWSPNVNIPSHDSGASLYDPQLPSLLHRIKGRAPAGNKEYPEKQNTRAWSPGKNFGGVAT